MATTTPKLVLLPSDTKGKRAVSYSSLDLFKNCPWHYKLKYTEGHTVGAKGIQLDIGTICHKIMELKGRCKMNNEPVDPTYLEHILYTGIEEQTDKGTEHIKGILDIRKQYFETWAVPDDKSGKTYEEKLMTFVKDVVPTRMEDSEWQPIALEKSFTFSYNDRIIIHGFIDRVDQNRNGDLRVVDYKTSKSSYSEATLKTPLQMFIYALACEALYSKRPIAFQYDFLLLNELQDACSFGWYNRGLKKLDKILDQMDEGADTYRPSPSPLCYWCEFCENNPDAPDPERRLCPYYSLWTPTNKTFEKNQEFNTCQTTVEEVNKSVRKLVF